MTTQIQVDDELHTAVLKKLVEYRENGVKKLPSITELVNRAAKIGLKEIKE